MKFQPCIISKFGWDLIISGMWRYKKIILVGILLIGSIFILTQCQQNNKTVAENTNVDFSQFAGSKSCIQCHQKICDSFITTTHHLTSLAADLNNVKGSSDSLHNSYYFSPSVYIKIERVGDSLFQTAYSKGVKKISVPFNIVVGSGKRGQTFLFWNKNRLIQMPLSYFTETHEWTNSPGFSNSPVFNRPVTSRCLECHSTYFHKTSDTTVYPEEFSKTEIIYGIECERCHGPAAQHVTWHQQHPEQKTASYIINPGRLSRQESLELCRLCHGGKLSKTQPSFTYKVGEPLKNYFNYDDGAPVVSETDVHGNQFGMMSASKCFINSNMTCNSCHSSHGNETGRKEIFSQRCMSCHSQQQNNFCKLKQVSENTELKNNCIDCHMPELPSKAIMVLRQGEDIPTSAHMHTHFISVYKEIADGKLKSFAAGH